MNAILSIKELSYSYHNNYKILKNLSLEILSGEVVVITGPSGCGKSSLTRVINGLIPHFYGGDIEGDVFLKGKNINHLSTWERGKEIGNVFQDPRSQFFSSEVAGEIAFGCENYGFTHEEICRRVNLSAADLKIAEILHYNLHNLSYGMRQKVAIASANAIAPDIYVMDEPSANLDTESTYRLGMMIENLKSAGKTVIIAEHRLYYLKDIADRYIYMKNGEIIHEFSRTEMLNLDDEMIINYGLRHTDIRKSGFCYVPAEAHKTSPLLSVKHISKRYKENCVLEDVSFDCYRGEVIGIIGKNGTGKSTIGRILAGITKENKGGDIFLSGRKVIPKKRLSNIWYISQDLDSQLFGENLLDELLTGQKNVDRKKAEDILKQLNLWDFADQHPATLSGGQKQRLVFAAALFRGAPVIILDEPTSGLDGENMRNVSNIMKEIAKQGHTIILITHDVECALACCNRILYLEDGSIKKDFSLTSQNALFHLMGYEV